MLASELCRRVVGRPYCIFRSQFASHFSSSRKSDTCHPLGQHQRTSARVPPSAPTLEHHAQGLAAVTTYSYRPLVPAATILLSPPLRIDYRGMRRPVARGDQVIPSSVMLTVVPHATVESEIACERRFHASSDGKLTLARPRHVEV